MPFPLRFSITYSIHHLCCTVFSQYILCFFALLVYSVSLRQQLQDVGKKLVGAQHYNKDGAVNNRQETDHLLCLVICIFISFLLC